MGRVASGQVGEVPARGRTGIERAGVDVIVGGTVTVVVDRTAVQIHRRVHRPVGIEIEDGLVEGAVTVGVEDVDVDDAVTVGVGADQIDGAVASRSTSPPMSATPSPSVSYSWTRLPSASVNSSSRVGSAGAALPVEDDPAEIPGVF